MPRQPCSGAAAGKPHCAKSSVPSQRQLGAPPRPEQGLLIAKHLYDTVGGHSERAGDPEHDLLRRIGRRRIVKLATQAFGSP